jgi:TetR/AcrR family transcriptional repressor of nem operon
MGRVVTFSRVIVRDQALVMFWRRGFQATSVADLLETMGIGRGSFYAAFGDKRSLFIECLDLFAHRTQASVLQARTELPPIEALERFFERQFIASERRVSSHAHRVSGRSGPFDGPGLSRAAWGCMLVNTILEMADVDDELSARASHHLDEMQSIFERYLLEAPCAPAIAREFAALLMLINEGLRVASRRRVSSEDQLGPIRTTFQLLRRAIA